MRLKNLMENKQLDFNQPFLSVRRVSSMETSLEANETARTENRWPPLPVYKSELKSGPVRNPGNVPFLWEHAPGRPKDGRKSQTIALKSSTAIPKCSPGIDSKKQHCNSKGSRSGDAIPNSDHFPSHKNMVKFKTLRERIERDLSSDSEDGDETYLEANDTLSRSESFSMNCSVTGLSGLDGGDVKSSGTSKDQQTCDFMMGRFLPAAKALASETPQVSHRKQSVQREQQREAKKMVEMDKECRVNSLPLMLPSYHAPPNPQDDEESSGDDDVNLDESEYSSPKSCGLFARFCLRSSFCLLHPVPGMRTQGSSVASAHRVQNDNLTDSSCSSIKNLRNEEKSLNGNWMVELHEENTVLRGQLNRKGMSNDPKKHKPLLSEGKVFHSDPERVNSSKVHSEQHGSGRTKFRELLVNEPSSGSSLVVEKTLHVDSVHNMKSQSSNSKSADTKGITNCLMENRDKSTRSRETKEILHLDSNVESENKRLSSISMESMDLCSSYYNAKTNLKAISSKATVTDERTIDSESDQSERSGNQETSGSLHHKKLSQESSDDSCKDFISFTSSEASNREKLHFESKVVKGNSKGHDQDSITLTSSRATTQGKIDLESACQLKRSRPNSSQLALAPPLPKSPSESWLKRTLPTISSRNSVQKSNLAARNYATRKNTVF
ncbi:uncharacterized protein LOC120088823 [Benincasa hispida]|uniref:uncharacterized protein LOC120088823 n=1 Tax=Benincasa hispida TaxID=102211 RepID=UPI0018FF4163|nr:uncharacterized protein LOC120088823 [Benincasa hispida]XP_038902197.1 uncharacterized protein LOC120088823 [Benincasa hispida]